MPHLSYLYPTNELIINDNNEEFINLQMIPTEENIENIRNENNVPAPDDDDVVVLHETWLSKTVNC